MNRIVPLEGFGRVEKEYVEVIKYSTLNFNIKSYSSEEELLNSIPDEDNTIGVVTNTPITNWAFGAKEPDNPNNGFLFIKTNPNSSIEFSVVKEQEIYIYPTNVKQYINGVWVILTAKNYKDNKWNNWIDYNAIITEINTSGYALYTEGATNEYVKDGYEGRGFTRTSNAPAIWCWVTNTANSISGWCLISTSLEALQTTSVTNYGNMATPKLYTTKNGKKLYIGYQNYLVSESYQPSIKIYIDGAETVLLRANRGSYKFDYEESKLEKTLEEWAEIMLFK